MGFAADAVIDAIAPPPPRTANPRAPSDPSKPTFDQHLEAATEQDEPPAQSASDAPARPKPNTKKDDDPVCALPADPDAAAIPAPAPDTAAPLIVQLIAPAPVATPPDPPAQVTAPVEAPMQAAGPAPTHAPTSEPLEQAPADTNGAAAAASETPHHNAQHKSAPAQPNPAAPVQTAAPPAEAVAAAPPSAPAPGPQAASMAPANQAVAAASAQAPQQTPPPRVSANNRAKALRADSEAKTEAPRADVTPAPAATANAAQRTAPKSQASTPIPADSTPPPLAAPGDATDVLTTASTAALATQSASQAQHAAIEHTTTRATHAAAQVAHEIVRRFDGGNTRFELRLDPPELGRVDVRLDVSRDHRVTAVIAADNPQALTELARHSRELEQMLQSAGLELSDSGLSFDLRQGGEGAADGGEANPSPSGASTSDLPAQPQARPLGFERWRGVRVDMMV